MSYRFLIGFSIGAFVLAFTCLICGIWLQSSAGHQGGSQFTMVAVLWVGVGLLAGWSGKLIQQLSDRLDKIEARLSQGPASGSGGGRA